MDIAELVSRHPKLFERILAKSTGALGEIIVADRLVQMGYQVAPTDNNARQSDLIATSPSGIKFSIEVKADRARRPTWFVRTRPIVELSSIWVFLSAPRNPSELPDPDSVEMYVLTALETQALWDSSDWNKGNPTNGDMRRWQVPDDALHAWHKLPV